MRCGREVKADLMVVILPENAADLYTAVKRFGDVTVGVATQCVVGNHSFDTFSCLYSPLSALEHEAVKVCC